MGSFMGADIVLMGELALLGKLLLIEDRLFYRRMSREAASASFRPTSSAGRRAPQGQAVPAIALRGR